MLILPRLRSLLEQGQAAVLVTVERVEGSAPREAGARMIVRTTGDFHGTIGGGTLEWEALHLARDLLAPGARPVLRRDFALGPELSQCCGGRVRIHFERFRPEDRDRVAALAQAEIAASNATSLGLFGAGHVGRALVLALAPLPFIVRWIDERADAFPAAVPANVTKLAPKEPLSELDALPEGAFVLVMTHSHPLDLAITAKALESDRFAYVGLIGSATKRARFLHRMEEAGVSAQQRARLVCPIGLRGIEGKEPAIIAASTAAALLIARETQLKEVAHDN
ncbi:MAG: XdhC protein [Hyphomicrobiales bacterium]|nr:XdhC protein [Hyphomicrobiales bacterium]